MGILENLVYTLSSNFYLIEKNEIFLIDDKTLWSLLFYTTKNEINRLFGEKFNVIIKLIRIILILIQNIQKKLL